MKTLITTVLVTLILAGCSSSAQLVRKDTGGGRVALQGAFMPAMGEARVLMAAHCGGRFDAVEGREVVEFRCRDARMLEPAVQVAGVQAQGGQLVVAHGAR